MQRLYIWVIASEFAGLKYSLLHLGCRLVLVDSNLLRWRSQLSASDGLY
jgi:hypothetical protein